MKGFFKDLNNDVALRREIENVVSSFGYVVKGKNYYNFRCQICGDSKRSKLKKRGYILTKKKPWIYFCHNCFYKKPVIAWLKEYHPQSFRNFIAECIRLNKSEKEEITIVNPKLRVRKTEDFDEKSHTKFFVPILKGLTWQFAYAQALCRKRKIPDNVWHKWFVATDGMYRDRIIIPFYNDKGKIYFYQGRSLKDDMLPKYLSRHGEFNSVYNYYLVDKTKFVHILEGPIDSIFVDNSVALTGLKIEDIRLGNFMHKRFILDNDASGYKMAKNLMNLGESVFLWKKFINHYMLCENIKDINDAYIALNRFDKFTTKELDPFFSKSLFDMIHLV